MVVRIFDVGSDDSAPPIPIRTDSHRPVRARRLQPYDTKRLRRPARSLCRRALYWAEPSRARPDTATITSNSDEKGSICQSWSPKDRPTASSLSNISSERSPGELHKSLSASYLMFMLAVGVCWGQLGDRNLALASIFAWGPEGAVAALVGKRYGKNKIGRGGKNPWKERSPCLYSPG